MVGCFRDDHATPSGDPRADVNTAELEIVGRDGRAQGYSNGYLLGIDGFVIRR